MIKPQRKIRSWHRVKEPKPWRPKEGEELTGVYLGSQIRNGMFGEYLVYFVRCRNGVFMVSGAQLNNLFALIGEGEPVKIIYTGLKISKSTENEYKTFELYTEHEVEFKLVG